MSNTLATTIWYLLIVAGGAALAVQQVLNSRLRLDLGSPWWAGFASYFVGLLAMVAILVVVREPLPDVAGPKGSSVLTWAGGVFGAIYICIAILTVPRFGAATVLALIVVGQMIGSTLFDHFGLLGIPQQPATLARFAGAAFLVLGVVLIRS